MGMCRYGGDCIQIDVRVCVCVQPREVAPAGWGRGAPQTSLLFQNTREEVCVYVSSSLYKDSIHRASGAEWAGVAGGGAICKWGL